MGSDARNSLLRRLAELTHGSNSDKIRDFELTLEDSARLAECFNSFDDSDSWPGGFTGGIPFTAERVLEDKTKRNDIRTLVAYIGDRIIGHCNVAQAEMDPEAAYVGTLGVDPKYQGQGFGKAMLIEAAETAARLGKRRIDLHTWPGNIKAMPLYKRVGYNWVPRTRVLMESYIPGILSFPLFAEFFKRYTWHEVFTREIHQVVDDIEQDGLGVYRYFFRGQNDDSLDVTVDREAKGICSFKLVFDHHEISAGSRQASPIGYIGYGQVAVHLIISSNDQHELPVTVSVVPTQDLSVELTGDMTGMVSAGHQFVLGGFYGIPETAEKVDREKDPTTKVRAQAAWEITLGDTTFNLYSGLIPHQAITISSNPVYPCISPGSQPKMEIVLHNNLIRVVKGEVVVSPASGKTMWSRVTEFELDPDETRGVALQVATAAEDDNSVLPLLVSVFVLEDSEKRAVNRKTFNIPVLGVSGAVVYESLDDYLVIESETFRYTISKTPPMSFRSFEDKTQHRVARGFFLLPSVGYPFPSGGSEWSRRAFDVTLANNKDYAEIRLEGDSIEKTGARLTAIYRAYPSRQYLEIINGITNVGSSTLTNLGVQTQGWFEMAGTRMYVPIRGSIYELGSIDWTGDRQVPDEPSAYHESWAAVCSAEGGLLVGYAWDADGLVKVEPRRSRRVTRTEYKLPDLEPGESSEKTILRIVTGLGGWRKVRSLWAQLNNRPEPDIDVRGPRSDLEFSVVPKSSSWAAGSGAPIMIDRLQQNEMEIRVSVLHADSISGQLSVTLPSGLLINKKSSVTFDIKRLNIDTPFTAPVTITAIKGGEWIRIGGEALFRFENRVARIPLVAILYDSTASVERSTEVVEGNTLYQLKTAGNGISVSPEYCASLVRLKLSDNDNVFQDLFPHADPFLWTDRHYSGLNPIIGRWGTWDWQSGLLLEKWSVSEAREGPWVGYEIKAILEHCPGLKGMQFSIKHMILKGTPIVRSDINARNGTSQSKRVTMGLQGIVRLKNHPQSVIYAVINNRRVAYEPSMYRTDVIPAPEEGWAVFKEPETGSVLGVVADCKTDEVLSLENVNENAQWVRLMALRELGPGDNASIGCYFITAKNVDDVVMMKNLASIM